MKHIPKRVKDYLVSHEEFELRRSKKIEGLIETYPIPSENKIASYYESDEYISHANHAKGLLNKVYFWVKNYNQKYKQRLFSKSGDRQIKTLDYGCGVGDFVQYLNKKGYNAYGIEPNQKAYKIALSKNPDKIFVDSNGLTKNNFDVITLYHVLEHIPNLHEEIAKITSALKPNGELFIAVPNYQSLDALYYKKYWAAYDVPRHLWHFNQQAIQEIFGEFGMIIESTHPLWFDAFYISLVSEKYRKSSLGFLIGSLVGLISNLSALFTGEFSSKIYKITRK